MELARTRRSAGCEAPLDDETGEGLSFRGRPAVEFRGRVRGGGAVHDFAIVDAATVRVVSYACFSNTSTRRAGEQIISLSEISSGGDRLAAALLPGANLALESIRRYRMSGQESIYYEARYTPPPSDFPFFEPPVRLLLNASTGTFFRIDIDPDWLDPGSLPRFRIARKAAERIATVVLGRYDLATALGSGARFSRTAAAELYMLRPNDWLGLHPDDRDTRAQLAWVVPFLIEGGTSPGPHNLFVDAASGRVLGGQSAGTQPR